MCLQCSCWTPCRARRHRICTCCGCFASAGAAAAGSGVTTAPFVGAEDDPSALALAFASSSSASVSATYAMGAPAGVMCQSAQDAEIQLRRASAAHYASVPLALIMRTDDVRPLKEQAAPSDDSALMEMFADQC